MATDSPLLSDSPPLDPEMSQELDAKIGIGKLPQKRGRGRPSKSKSDLPVADTSKPPRSRGRPPKSSDSQVLKKAKSKGRPSKDKTDLDEPPSSVAQAATPVKGRGRPAKAKPAMTAVGC